MTLSGWKIYIIAATALVGFIGVPAPGPVFAQDTYIRNVFISNSATHIQVQFELNNSFGPKMEEAIKTGIPTTFDYYIELYQNRSLWDDQLLTSLVITRIIKYDTLKQEYIVTEKSNVDGNSVQIVGSLEEAKEFMNNIKVHSFFPMAKLERTKAYYVKIKARSQGVAPPGYIHFIPFFKNWINFNTDWVIETFYY